MHIIHDFLRPFRHRLALRLRQLQEVLEALRQRLHTAIADALGQTVGAGIRDGLRQLMVGVSESALDWDASTTPYGRRRQNYRGTVDNDADGLLAGGDLWHDPDDLDRDRGDGREVPAQENRPLPLAVAAWIRAAAWLGRRYRGRDGLFLVAGVALAVGGLAYLTPGLANAGLQLARSAARMGLLADGLRLFGIV
jgi:hypothetical protein